MELAKKKKQRRLNENHSKRKKNGQKLNFMKGTVRPNECKKGAKK